jgi:TonB family protein
MRTLAKTVAVCILLSVSLRAEAQMPGDGRIRVGARAEAAKIVKQVEPVYPGYAILGKVSGTVKLRVVIAGNGTVKEINYISGPPMLMYSAMDAVREWKYKQTLLDDEPIEVDTTVSLIYRLTGPGQGKVGIEQEPQEQEPHPEQGPRRIWIGGNVTALKPAKRVEPRYPKLPSDAPVREDVRLWLVIATDGSVKEVTAGSASGELARSAIDAVKQWKYQPPELDGEPVEIETTVDIFFMNDLPH